MHDDMVGLRVIKGRKDVEDICKIYQSFCKEVAHKLLLSTNIVSTITAKIEVKHPLCCRPKYEHSNLGPTHKVFGSDLNALFFTKLALF